MQNIERFSNICLIELATLAMTITVARAEKGAAEYTFSGY
jgi:hypothetical protein